MDDEKERVEWRNREEIVDEGEWKRDTEKETERTNRKRVE